MLILTLICTLASVLPAQGPPNAPRTRTPGGSLTDRVDGLFAQWDRPGSPGCALAVVRDGALIYKRGYGMANLEHSIPIAPNTAFNLESIAKQFTAMAVALLIQQGRLSLDDDVRKYLPEVPDFGSPITVRHLLYHTSGLREQYYMLELAGWRWDDVVTNDDVLDLVARQRGLNFRPGDEYAYTNTGYTLLAVIVQRVSGQSLREFAERNIFRPLGMADTHFQDDHTALVRNRAASYHPRQEGGFRISVPVIDTAGPGNLFSTVEDLARWDRNFYDRRVGGEAGVSLMLTPGTLNTGERILTGDRSNYGLGLNIGEYKGLRAVWHAGAGEGFRTEFMRFPDQRFSVILLCNLSSIEMETAARQVADLYLADQLRAAVGGDGPDPRAGGSAVVIPERELSTVAGLYYNPANNNLRRLYVRDGKLMYFRSAGSESELLPLGDQRFLMLGVPGRAEVVFRPAPPGGPRQMLVIVDGGRPSVFESVEPASYTAAQLAGYAGAYRSEELGTTYTLIVRDGTLWLRRRKFADGPLTAVFADAFNSELGTIRFRRGPRGRVSGFTLSNAVRGVRSLPFVKEAG